MLRWQQIDPAGIAIPRTRASEAPRLNAIKPDGYWWLFHP
jgi:hypothetical protein